MFSVIQFIRNLNPNKTTRSPDQHEGTLEVWEREREPHRQLGERRTGSLSAEGVLLELEQLHGHCRQSLTRWSIHQHVLTDRDTQLGMIMKTVFRYRFIDSLDNLSIVFGLINL